MGSISIGLKTKPKGEISTHLWDSCGNKYVAINNQKSTVYLIREFCDNYTNKEKAEKAYKEYIELGCKYVIDTRYFSFGSSRSEAIKDLLKIY